MTFEFHFVQKSCVGRWKTTILPQILRFEFHFVRMGCILNLKIIFLHQFLTCDAACLVAKSKISISRHICASETHAPQRVYSRTTRAQDKFAFHHMFPNMHDLRRGLIRRTHNFHSSNVTACLCVRHAPSPQRVTFFKPPPICLCRQKREILKNLGSKIFCRSSDTSK